ncbi:hypothetical protein ACSVH2_12310 [Flavobacterium sp. RSB2_4_14]|uniref:hypothetical protein n=1 Tax=Flavobacterium sp. RSB2_4_14 TaxID=3447665 RepID=UPI003F3A64C4
MAKVIAPFKIVGTLNGLNFFMDQTDINRVREKGKTGVSSEEFKRNPVFTKVKNHGKEFGRAAKKGQSFRGIALYFNKRAKDGSYSGRGNKLMFEIIEEDTTNPHGERTFETGIETPETRSFFIGFEGNILRPLKKVLKTNWTWEENKNTLTFPDLNPSTHIDWPNKADNVHIAIAHANWNYIDNKFETCYSQEVIMHKEEEPQTLVFTTESAIQNTAGTIQLLYLFIGFSIQERKKIKELKRSNNTVSIIWSK